jgi:K+-transporting ATPase KdpF subunit
MGPFDWALANLGLLTFTAASTALVLYLLYVMLRPEKV